MFKVGDRVRCKKDAIRCTTLGSYSHGFKVGKEFVINKLNPGVAWELDNNGFFLHELELVSKVELYDIY